MRTRIQNLSARRTFPARNGVSGPGDALLFVPETWVTLCAEQAQSVDAVEGNFGHGRTPAIRGPLAGRQGHDRHYDLISIDLEQRTLQAIDNPFGAKL